MIFDAYTLLKRKDGRWRVDPALLYPPFGALLLRVLEKCHERGHDYYATSGLRWFEEQEKLHKAHIAGGPKAAPPGLSAHQYGIAVDCAPDADESTPGLQGPDYSATAYQVLIEEAEAVGLVSGSRFNDNPHVQWPSYVSGRELRELRDVYLHAAAGTLRIDRLRRVWQHLDAGPIPAPLVA